ncbi:MAG: tetratricopeptide repeat protein, partial [Comamonas sp.]|nr:tetratricopeptide repeat protein [Comamonas sp.]
MKPNFFPSARSLCSLLVAAAFCTIASAQAADSSEITQLLKQNQPAQALARIDSLLTFSPKDPQLHFLKGVAQAMSDKTQEAINTFTQLTQEYPDLPEPYNNLAVLYANQNQLDKSRQALEQAIRTNPSYSTAHENLGDIYAKMASQAYNKALQLEGSNANSLKPKLSLIHDLFSVAPGAAAVAAATAAASSTTATSSASSSPNPTVTVAAATKDTDSNNNSSAQPLAPAPTPKPQPVAPSTPPSTSATPPVAPQVAPAAPIVSPSTIVPTPTPTPTTGNAGNT